MLEKQQYWKTGSKGSHYIINNQEKPYLGFLNSAVLWDDCKHLIPILKFLNIDL